MAQPKRSHGVKVAGHTNMKTGANLPSTPSPARSANGGQTSATGRTGKGKMSLGPGMPGRT